MTTEWQHPEISKKEAETMILIQMQQIEKKIGEALEKLKEHLNEPPDDMNGRNIFSPYQSQIISLQRCFYNLKIAVERIDQGIWGICEECEETIPRERLEIRPEVKLCIDCKAKGERQKIARNGGKRFIYA